MEIIRTRPEPTFEHFYFGAIVIVGGLTAIFTNSNILVGFILLTAGVFILLSIKGMLINPETKSVKHYFNFFFIKIGNWVSLDEFTHLILGPNSSSQVIGKFANSTFRTNSYSVSLLDQKKKAHEIQEFSEYKEALEYTEFISKEIGLPIINKEELIKKRAAEKRKFRK